MKDGAKAVTVNFHNENRVPRFSRSSLRDCMDSALELAKAHDVSLRCDLVRRFQLPGAGDYAKTADLDRSNLSQPSKRSISSIARLMDGVGLSEGRRIDVAIFKIAAKILKPRFCSANHRRPLASSREAAFTQVVRGQTMTDPVDEEILKSI